MTSMHEYSLYLKHIPCIVFCEIVAIDTSNTKPPIN